MEGISYANSNIKCEEFYEDIQPIELSYKVNLDGYKLPEINTERMIKVLLPYPALESTN